MSGVRLDVRHDLDKLISKIRNLRTEQLPFALAKSVTATAQLVKRAETTELLYAFDRPTPYTMGSLYLAPATKAIPVAKVWLKDDAGKGTPAARYLLPEITGGGRRFKRMELALAARGLLPPGMYVMPGAAAKIDAFGNWERGQVTQVLSAMGAAEMRSGYLANRTKESAKRKGRNLAEYFVGKPGGTAPLGVWQRINFGAGSAVKPIAIFTRAPVYRERYRFQVIAEQVVREEFPNQFSLAYQQAVVSAR
jgi:hypothetical protein